MSEQSSNLQAVAPGALAGLKVLDMVSHPGFRSRFLYWEGWRDPRKAEPVSTAG